VGKQDDFGEHLKRLVGDAGLTVAAFAKAISCHVDAPQKWFAGKSYPHRKYHKRMAEVLGVPVQVMLMQEVHGSMKAPIAPPVAAATMKEETTVDPLLTQTLLSIQLRLDKIDRAIDEMRVEVKSHQHPLSYGAPRKKSA
jgi:hypothetical protein